MNEAISRMLQKYHTKSPKEQNHALREILQEIALVGLWRAKFFDHAAFYGGTSLRMLYGLDRFSEDLNFTLFNSDPLFSWKPYAKFVIEEIKSYGFEVSMDEKIKTKESAIRSAFLKANTIETMLLIGQSPLKIHKEALIKIRVEIDTNPPLKHTAEPIFLQDPLPVPIMSVIQSELFAGKIHAALYRVWKNRVKGRDWYDLIWFIRREIKLDLQFLETYMRASGSLKDHEHLSKEKLISLLETRLSTINFQSLIEDIGPFIRDETILKDWTPEFFKTQFSKIKLK